MKKGKIIGVLAVSACMLTGCIDNMPDMTEEQSELVAEYAADMLLKYSPNYNYRIASDEEIAEVQTESETQQEEESSQVESTQVQQEQASGDTVSATAETVLEDGAEYDLAALFGMDNMSIRYQSFEVTDSYPKAESGSGFSVTAPQGRNLLIIYFDIENISGETAQCDLFDQVGKVRVNVNDGGYVEALSTLLTNDFTTYMEDIPAGETQSAVVAVPVEQSDMEEISSVIMRVVTENDVVNIKLQ